MPEAQAETLCPEHAAEIVALVKEQGIKAKGTPGAAVLVQRHGKVLHMAGYGCADVATGKRVSLSSMFDFASMSKHITALAILKLEEDGKLSLDDEVVTHLPDFAVPVKGCAVTIRDLLNHVSGLTEYTAGDERDGFDMGDTEGLEFDTLTAQQHVRWINGTKAKAKPGTKYAYLNSGYVLLSAIVERVAGMRFQSFVQEQLFAPAGVTHAYIRDGSRPLPAERVVGYAPEENDDDEEEEEEEEEDKPTKPLVPSDSPSIITGDGNVFMNIADLARWLSALQAGKVISKESLAKAWTNGMLDNGKAIADGDEADGYGFGFIVDGGAGPVVSHAGDWVGTATEMRLNTETGLTVAVMCNCWHAGELSNAGKLCYTVADLYDPEEEDEGEEEGEEDE
jgi:CubicO group peptidase (beta-lactamase class C family)